MPARFDPLELITAFAALWVAVIHFACGRTVLAGGGVGVRMGACLGQAREEEEGRGFVTG